MRRQVSARAVERRVARQQVVEGTAEAVEVGADVGRARVEGLLRGDVVGRPHEGALRGDGAVRLALLGGLTEAGQSQVQDLEHPAAGHQQVRRLDVSVDQSMFVGARKPNSRPLVGLPMACLEPPLMRQEGRALHEEP